MSHIILNLQAVFNRVYFRENFQIICVQKWCYLKKFVKSLIRITNMSGPRTDSCGTPDFARNLSNWWPIYLTYWYLLDKYNLNKKSKLSEKPKVSILCNITEWLSLSKVLYYYVNSFNKSIKSWMVFKIESLKQNTLRTY